MDGGAAVIKNGRLPFPEEALNSAKPPRPSVP